MPFIGPLSGGLKERQSSQVATLDSANHYHKRRSYSTYTGSSSGTFVIMRYARHWWGTGNFHIHIYATWYGNPSSYGHFLVNNNTRSGLAGISTVFNTGISTPVAAGYDSTYERCNIQFSHSGYFRHTIVCEVHESVYSTSDAGVGLGASAGANSWHMYGSTEVI